MLALVTGASSGIGLMYARELARQGHDLLLVSNQEAELQNVANQIKRDFGVQTIWQYKDLSAPDAPEQLHTYCRDNHLQVDILINNAGVFFFNDLMQTSPSRMELMLNLHVLCVARMTRLFGQDMKERGRGYILNMSSLSCWVNFPGIQCYSATKAFINTFSRSLWYELKPYGVNVISVTPGAVDTGLYGLSDYWRRIAVALRVSIRPEQLVQIALRRMFRGKQTCMPGLLNHLSLPLVKHLPDWLVFFVVKRLRQFMK